MSYAAKFVLSYLETKIGKRAAKQIIYIILMAFGVHRKTIKTIYGASGTTLCKYDDAIKNERLESVFEQEYNHPESELERHKDEIFEALEKRPPASRREAAVIIEEVTGIKRSLPRIGKFLKKGHEK